MRAGGRLQEACNRGPGRTTRRRHGDCEEDVRPSCEVRKGRPDPDAGDHADQVLALSADVEEAAAEGERNREPGEDQRGRQDQRLLQVVGSIALDRRVPGEPNVMARERHGDAVVTDVEEPVQARTGEDALVDLPGVVARGQHDHAAHEEREDRSDDRRDDAARALVDLEPLRDARGVRGGVGRERLAGRRSLEVAATAPRLRAHAATSSRPPPVIASRAQRAPVRETMFPSRAPFFR